MRCAHPPRGAPAALLNTIVFFPLLARTPPKEPVGTVLYRTPYNATSLADAYNVSTEVEPFVVDPGMAVVLQDVRGCGPEGVGISPCELPGHGQFTFPNTSMYDGYDTVEWIIHQPWSNGKVVLDGPSALAVDSYELITLNPHPAIKAVSLEIGEAAEHSQWFPGGAYRLGMAEIYTNLLGGSNESTRPSQLIGALRAAEGWGQPWAAQSAWYTGTDGLTGWERGRKAGIAGVHVAGWYDVFSEAQLETFFQLNDTSLGATAPQWLWVVPGGHCTGSAVGWPLADLLPAKITTFSANLFHLLANDPSPAVKKDLQEIVDNTPKLNYYMVGPGIKGTLGNTWHHTNTWPKTEMQRWYLSDVRDSLTLGHPGRGERSFIYDPSDPAGMSGGNNLFLPTCGPQDQILVEGTNESVYGPGGFYDVRLSDSCYNNSCHGACRKMIDDAYNNVMQHPRSDLLRYTSAPMRMPTSILGNVTVDLVVSSNATDTDFIVKVRPREFCRSVACARALKRRAARLCRSRTCSRTGPRCSSRRAPCACAGGGRTPTATRAAGIDSWKSRRRRWTRRRDMPSTSAWAWSPTSSTSATPSE